MIKTSSRCLFTLTLLVLAIVVVTVPAQAQTYSVLYNFSPGTKSGDPSSPQYSGIIAQGHNGNLYSTTPVGGTLCGFCGVVFQITSAGALTHVYDFNDTTGLGLLYNHGLTVRHPAEVKHHQRFDTVGAVLPAIKTCAIFQIYG